MAIVEQVNQRSCNCVLLTIAFTCTSAVLLSVYLAMIGGTPWHQSREDCRVELASYGNTDSSTRYCYVRTSGGSSEDVHVLDQYGKSRNVQRGLTLMELDITTCTTKNRQRFDTYESHDNRAQLLESLNLKTTGTVIVGVTADTAENEDNASLRKIIGPFFGGYGMELSGLKVRGKLAFIMEIGYPRKSLYKIKPNGGESLLMKIEVHGTSVHDVTFKQL